MNPFLRSWHFLIDKSFGILTGILVTILVSVFVLFVIVMYSESPRWIFNFLGVSENGKSKYEALKFLGISMGGILVAWQALASHRRAKAMEDTAKHTEHGLRQDRLKNAIEHLGHEKDSVRLGGAYELFHLAEDNKDLRKTAFDMLCLHIRQTTGEKRYQEKHKSKPSEEVQNLLTLLFVQDHGVFKGLPINLRESYLNGADLQRARLEKAILTEVHLQRANLREARLQGANLLSSHLQETYLWWAHLQGANLYSSHLQGSNLWWAHLERADLHWVHLQGADLRGAYLQGADLHWAYLQGANFSGAHLPGVDLRKAHLQGAFLDEAHLQGAFLGEAHLQGATCLAWSPSVSFRDRIRNQIGTETNLSGAILEGGLKKKDLNFLLKGLSNRKANELREKLEPHIGIPESNELSKDSGAITGVYTEEEAEQWIVEYEKAMSEVPEDDS